MKNLNRFFFMVGATMAFFISAVIVHIKSSDEMKDYQIEVGTEHILIYDKCKLIGRCTYIGTQLDSLITKDNK